MKNEKVTNPQRRAALERYYANPNKCLYCNEIIDVKEGGRVFHARQKKYCNNSCAAKVNNKKFPKREYEGDKCSFCTRRIARGVYSCRWCGIKITLANNLKKSMGKLFCKGASRAKYNEIRFLSRKVLLELGRDRKCIVCKYDNDKIIEVCHIKALSKFSDDALIMEVNALSNLEYLCPTHHKEFDKGILNIKNYRSNDEWKMKEFLEKFGHVA